MSKKINFCFKKKIRKANIIYFSTLEEYQLDNTIK